MTVGQKLKQLREELGLTQGQVATYAGLERSYVTRLEKDHIKNPSANKLGALARALHVDPNVFQETTIAPPIPYDVLVRRAEYERPISVPVVEQLGHAGEGAVAQDYIYLPAPIARNRNLKAIRVKGDCMEPTIGDGDLIIVDLDGSPSESDIVVALIDRDDVQVKRLARKLNSHIVLSCDNPTYPEIEVEDVQIIGIVIQSSKVFKG